MGKVKEYGYDVAEHVARNTGEDEWEVRKQWEKARTEGVTPEEFFQRKARKKHLPK